MWTSITGSAAGLDRVAERVRVVGQRAGVHHDALEPFRRRPPGASPRGRPRGRTAATRPRGRARHPRSSTSAMISSRVCGAVQLGIAASRARRGSGRTGTAPSSPWPPSPPGVAAARCSGTSSTDRPGAPRPPAARTARPRGTSCPAGTPPGCRSAGGSGASVSRPSERRSRTVPGASPASAIPCASREPRGEHHPHRDRLAVGPARERLEPLQGVARACGRSSGPAARPRRARPRRRSGPSPATHRATSVSSASARPARGRAGVRSRAGQQRRSNVRPYFATSASPERKSGPDSVASVVHVGEDRRGWWNVPTRFLPSGRFTAVLPPIAASTCAVSVVGTWTKRHPAHVGGGDEPREVAGRPAAERHDEVVAMRLLRGELVVAGRRRPGATSPPRPRARPGGRAQAGRAASPAARRARYSSATVASATTNAVSASGSAGRRAPPSRGRRTRPPRRRDVPGPARVTRTNAAPPRWRRRPPPASRSPSTTWAANSR